MSENVRYTYTFSVTNYTIQFADLFNEFYVKRRDEERNIINNIKVPLIYQPFEVIAYELTDESPEKTRKYYQRLPIISFSLSSMDMDNERRIYQFGEYYDNTGVPKRVRVPVPYKLIYEVTAWAKYMDDLMQIVEQIGVKFNPSVAIIIKEPNFDIKVTSPVILISENVEYTGNYGISNRRILRHTFRFEVSAYLFNTHLDLQGIINTINVRYFDINENLQIEKTITG